MSFEGSAHTTVHASALVWHSSSMLHCSAALSRAQQLALLHHMDGLACSARAFNSH